LSATKSRNAVRVAAAWKIFAQLALEVLYHLPAGHVEPPKQFNQPKRRTA
jgi:hypothetical protein